MTYQEQLKAKLEQHISFRERRFRATGLMILTLRHLNLEEKYNEKRQFTMEEMIDIAKIYDNFRHEFDAVQKNYPHLRGKDYPDGAALAQEKCLEFGYQPGFHEINRKLSTING